MFSTIIIFDQNEQSAAIDFAEWPILAIFKNVSFLEYWMFFKAIFLPKKALMQFYKRFYTFNLFNFDPK